MPEDKKKKKKGVFEKLRMLLLPSPEKSKMDSKVESMVTKVDRQGNIIKPKKRK